MSKTSSTWLASVTLSGLLLAACGGDAEDSFQATGGSASTTGGRSFSTGGTPFGTGGTSLSTGGTPFGTGGTSLSTGGASLGSGGAPLGRGGAPASGGSSGATGGAAGAPSAGSGGHGGMGPMNGGRPGKGEAGGGGAPGGGGGAPAGGVSGSGGVSGLGGVSGASGSGGANSSGGSGGASSLCPAKAPKADTMCSAGLQCSYADTKCDCTGPAGNARWDCKPTPEACPMQPPAAGSKCTMAVPMATCPYPGNVECVCAATGWQCGVTSCPATRPIDKSECGVATTPKFSCEYTAGACDCDKGIWHCPP